MVCGRLPRLLASREQKATGCYQRDPVGGGLAPFISLGDEPLKRVIVTPAVYPRLVEFLHFDIQSTGQKSHRVYSRIPPVRTSSELTVRCRANAPTPRDAEQRAGRARVRAACARTQVEAYTRRLPEEGLEAVALHEDPGEEPFCSPADAPVATGCRRERRPVAHPTRETRNGKEDREGSGRRRA
ncbi:unnamed protein product [Acanthosepion pharaonis]|uniref:Uncharacterized protein n=1 Tax=Acanthosepion pharaonis TaxID=158019 RepID=A0A812B4K5_ACAPH|nr:unnamed protein product [Sepia pharaonis]